MDKIDRKILSLLQENARYPLKYLAQKVFLSSPAVSTRIERLEKAGILTGYHATIDPVALGYHITAFINLTLDPKQKDEFYPYVKDCPNVLECNCVTGTYSIMLKVAFPSTMELDTLKEGEYIHDFVGPLGVPTHTEGLKKVAVVGGGVGCAIAYPITKKLHQMGAEVHAIVGFRNQDLVILEDEFKAASDKLVMMTDDGSYGEKGLVTDALEKLIQDGNEYDEVIAIGPLIMMKFVCLTTKKYDIKTVVSMNPIMIDGTGMCGGCRLTVGGETKFACVDGPDFDGHLVDFDEAMHRGTMYKEFETHARDEYCNLLKKGEN